MSLRSSINTGIKRLEHGFQPYNRIEVSRSTLLRNFDLLESLSPGTILPVLKGNAYGHGLEAVATILRDRRFPYIAVDGYFEALRIREVTRQPILVMGAIAPQNFKHMNCRKFTFVMGDIAGITALAETGQMVKVHLELETGMGRHGITEQKLSTVLALLKQWPNLQLEGIMSHLADADNPNNGYTERQVAKFDELVENILAAGFAPAFIHLAQTAGTPKVHSRYANTTRVGIGLYGINPLEDKDPAAIRLASLHPVLKLMSTIAREFEAEAGESISYGCTFMAKHASHIGVLPLGYYEGVPRALSNLGVATSGNQKLPIVGRVCMNHTMIDLTKTKLQQGDEVTVISDQPDDPNSIQGICQTAKLFNYEILIGLNENIRRVIVD